MASKSQEMWELCSKEGSLEEVATLLDEGADIEFEHFDGRPLRRAINAENVEMVKLLLEMGADFGTYRTNFRKSDTALHDCASLSPSDAQVAVATLLLEKGAKADAEDANKKTPLHMAAKSCSPEVAKLLIGKKGNVNATDSSGETPLHTAATWTFKVPVVEILVENGCNPDAKNDDGDTALQIAKDNNQKMIVEFLESRTGK